MPRLFVISWATAHMNAAGYSFHTSLVDIPLWPYHQGKPFRAECTNLAWEYVDNHPAKSIGLRTLSNWRPLHLFHVVGYGDPEPYEIACIEDRTARESALSEYLRHRFSSDNPVVVTPNEARDARAALRVR